jgi:hypothetical protein
MPPPIKALPSLSTPRVSVQTGSHSLLGSCSVLACNLMFARDAQMLLAARMLNYVLAVATVCQVRTQLGRTTDSC